MGWPYCLNRRRSDLRSHRRAIALLIIALFVVAMVTLVHHRSPTQPRVVVLAASRARLMPDDTDPTTTTVAVQPREPMAPQVKWPPAPHHRGCGRSLDQIGADESGNNYTAVNPSSGAGGRFQILPSTWRSNGGQGLPQNAPPAEQDRIAQKIYAEQGTTPWRASGC